MTTYSGAIISEASNALKKYNPSCGPFRLLEMHYVIDGCRAVFRDMSCGQDYEMVVKPMNITKERTKA